MTRRTGRRATPLGTAVALAVVLAVFLAAAQRPFATAQAVAPGAVPAALADWQTVAGGRLAFAVATVKANRSDQPPKVNFTLGPGEVYSATGGRFRANNISLLDYIRFAWKLTDGQAEILEANAPRWIATEHFDIQAKAEASDPTKDQMRLMIQSLLAERFGLRTHAEVRELPVLALVLARRGRPGPQLHPHSPQDRTCSAIVPPAEQGSGTGATPVLPNVPEVCGGLVSVGVPEAPSHVRLGGRGVPLALLAAHLGQMGQYDRPIVDQTGLSGTYDFVLEWGPDPGIDSAAAPVHDDGPAYLQEALADQLGLKLERERAPLPVVLIDHIEPQPLSN